MLLRLLCFSFGQLLLLLLLLVLLSNLADTHHQSVFITAVPVTSGDDDGRVIGGISGVKCALMACSVDANVLVATTTTTTTTTIISFHLPTPEAAAAEVDLLDPDFPEREVPALEFELVELVPSFLLLLLPSPLPMLYN